jgi:hypothetical protein
MTPGCALNEDGLRAQAERYRRVGTGARLIDRSHRRLVVDLDEEVDPKLVDELIDVERECCPFFEVGWEPSGRRLNISVSRAEHEPALNAIAFALDVEK